MYSSNNMISYGNRYHHHHCHDKIITIIKKTVLHTYLCIADGAIFAVTEMTPSPPSFMWSHP